MRALLAWISDEYRTVPAANRLVLAVEHHDLDAVATLAPLVSLHMDVPETPIEEVEDRFLEILMDLRVRA